MTQLPTPTSPIEELINQEIEWCTKNNGNSIADNREYAQGFIGGLKQALFLARKLREG